MAFVQAVSVSTSALLSILTTPGITTTTGNFVVMGTSVLNNGNNPVPSDTNTNQWVGHALNPIVVTGQNDKGYSWYAKNIVGGSNHRFTVSSSATANSSIVVCEFSGRALDFPVAAQGGISETIAATVHSTGSVTTPFAGCDLCAYNFTSSTISESFTTGNIWGIPSNGQNNNGTQYQPSFAQVFSNASQGTFTNTWTTTGETVLGAGFIYAIKQPSFTPIGQASGSTSPGSPASFVTLPTVGSMAFTNGNLVIYVVKYGGGSPIPVTITDTLNNTWQQVSNYYDPAGNFGIAFGFAKNVIGGPDSVTCSVSTSQSFLAMHLSEWAGLSATIPFTTGEFVVTKVPAPGNGANGIATLFTGSIARRPALLFGFCIDGTNTTGQILTAGTNFNALPGVWTFGGTQNAALPEYQRI